MRVCELGIDPTDLSCVRVYMLGIDPTDLSCVRVCELGIDPTNLSCVRVCELGIDPTAGLKFDGGTAAICRRALLTGRNAL